jgi:hypothetical protein
MLLFNGLGAACAWALRSLPLNGLGLLLFGSMALLNAAFGAWALWSLWHSPRPAQPRGLLD